MIFSFIQSNKRFLTGEEDFLICVSKLQRAHVYQPLPDGGVCLEDPRSLSRCGVPTCVQRNNQHTTGPYFVKLSCMANMLVIKLSLMNVIQV